MNWNRFMIFVGILAAIGIGGALAPPQSTTTPTPPQAAVTRPQESPELLDCMQHTWAQIKQMGVKATRYDLRMLCEVTRDALNPPLPKE